MPRRTSWRRRAPTEGEPGGGCAAARDAAVKGFRLRPCANVCPLPVDASSSGDTVVAGMYATPTGRGEPDPPLLSGRRELRGTPVEAARAPPALTSPHADP